ncbi:recQ-mediated genome instability protein 2 isoform X1 [Cucumis sativus]|uniref:recQ-mediated genome instability protein 2 isoform X1 n=1 Tax=Cucumis sativus TaxID=3659 RepID=UPI0002B47CFC|nr:recQ-mediated genome instability protein 2 isoform X1 [Cucumis sativus]
MDYSLGALKLLCRQLKDARGTPSHPTANLGGILFQRAWLQGILVSVDKENGKLILDDATGTVELSLSRDFLLRPWSLGIFPTTSPFSFLLLHFELDSLAFFFCFCSGMYVMVVGAFLFRTNELPFIVVHKIIDLSKSPNREAMWYLEVMEAYKLFYEPLVEDFL